MNLWLLANNLSVFIHTLITCDMSRISVIKLQFPQAIKAYYWIIPNQKYIKYQRFQAYNGMQQLFFTQHSPPLLRQDEPHLQEGLQPDREHF